MNSLINSKVSLIVFISPLLPFQFGLRALIKSLQEIPSSNVDFLEEAAFVEKVKNNFGGPVYNYIEGPFSNQVANISQTLYLLNNLSIKNFVNTREIKLF